MGEGEGGKQRLFCTFALPCARTSPNTVSIFTVHVTLVFWMEPLQSSSRLGIVAWVWPFRCLGHSEGWTVVCPCGSAGERVDEERRDKVAY